MVPSHPTFIGPRISKRLMNKLRAARYTEKYGGYVKEYAKAYAKAYSKRNRKKCAENVRQWRLNNRERHLEYCRAYRKRPHVRKQIRESNPGRMRRRKATDPNFLIRYNTSGRIRIAIKAQSAHKSTRSRELIGCSYAELRAYIESMFLPGMTWDNHGRFGWHIDHIIPCAAFDLTDMDQQKMCFHYSNMRPLWAEDNIDKGDKITPDAIAKIVASQETIETDVLPFYVDRTG